MAFVNLLGGKKVFLFHISKNEIFSSTFCRIIDLTPEVDMILIRVNVVCKN